MAEPAVAEIGLAAVRVDEAGGEGIPSEGVEGEIAAGGGVVVVEERIGLDGEAAVAGAGLGFAAGQGDVVFDAGREAEFDHAEATADHVGGA